jgi:hypothetical protein
VVSGGGFGGGVEFFDGFGYLFGELIEVFVGLLFAVGFLWRVHGYRFIIFSAIS